MTAAKDPKFTIENVGPISFFEFTVPVGVLALKGPNGIGKTTALTAVEAAYGNKEASAALTANDDGIGKGRLLANGCTILTLGKVNRQTGKAEISLASTSPLADLIQPKQIGKEAADKARIAAALKLTDWSVTEETVRILVNRDPEAYALVIEDEDMELLMGMDPVALADFVRRKLHKVKRSFEETREIAMGRIAVYDQTEMPEKMTDIPVAQAQDEYETAVRTLERLSGESSQRNIRETERSDIERTLGERPDIAEFTAALEEAKGDLARIVAARHEIENEIAVLQERLKTETAHVLDQQREIIDKTRNLALQKEAAEQWDRRRAILDVPITGATGADVLAANEAKYQTSLIVEIARKAAAYREAIENRDIAHQEYVKADSSATKYDALATSVTAQLGEILGSSVEGLTVDDGVLCVLNKGKGKKKKEPFSRLSFGQRVKIGLVLMLKRFPDMVIALPWTFWDSLDPSNKAEMVKLAVEHGARIITEIPTEGNLRAEVIS